MHKEIIGKATLYLGDCMDGMKEMPDKAFDLAIVDPPYGNTDAIGMQNGKNHAAARSDYRLFKNIAPGREYFEELKRIARNQIVWGGNFFGLAGGAICWNKYGTAFGEAELAYCSKINSVRVFEYAWNGMIQQDMKNKETRIHPTQKPVALYRWLLMQFAKPGDEIVDTHLGSGSSVIACLDRGHSVTAYEIDPEYFEAACLRIEQSQRQLQLAL